MNEKTKQIVEEAKAKNAASKTTVEDAPAPVAKEAPADDELPDSVKAEHEAGRTALKRHADAAKAARKAGGEEE